MAGKLVVALADMITARKTNNKLLLFNWSGRIIEIRPKVTPDDGRYLLLSKLQENMTFWSSLSSLAWLREKHWTWFSSTFVSLYRPIFLSPHKSWNFTTHPLFKPLIKHSRRQTMYPPGYYQSANVYIYTLKKIGFAPWPDIMPITSRTSAIS